MSTIPDTQPEHQDVIDFLREGAKSIHEIEQPDGKTEKQLIINPKKIWYETRIINSDSFSRFVFVLEEFGNMALDAFNHMSKERANVLGNQIMRKIESYNFSIDAKSSESVQDKHNNRGTLIHLMTNKTIEKKFTMKEDVKGRFAEGWFGGKDETR